ncbi:nucleoside phosphatase GDA1/CD39 [Piromyces finnis]|uniref:guanosine-diphosphatase n=1 Tax=Piromyces finnis TaxID=1754191 RepID=A0A1Y1UK44_9FUNG|nr:nucleoside phosphatase GDA1/CD39 [Piromyces finnis]ORX46455.1 nucleoside phosphatase GDA1/CD39 [Piromyces finnis]|eukprot:ORX37495.1 nucleoside phosphatase GDA1/CD39 [Piromyces finnis]
MIDAGSTGSRIHVYRFNYCNLSPTLEDETFKEIKPGLSSFPNSPKDAANSLEPLLQLAMEKIPKELQDCTPIAVKATAGLRLLGEEKSEAILKAVEDKIRKEYPFNLPKENGVIVMDGKDEGVYAWITVNYLLGKIGSENKEDTVAVMDLGGGSTQIVFEPLTIDHLQYPIPESDEDYRVELKFGSFKYVLYQHSYLGYGLMEARKSILSNMISTEHITADHSVVNKCFPDSFNNDIEVKGVDGSVTVTGTQGINFRDCYKTVKAALFDKTLACKTKPCSFDGIYQPSIRETFSNNDIYAFSYFYDRTTVLGLGLNPEIEDIAELARKVCSNTNELADKTKDDPYFCLDLTYLYALLSYGYDINTDRKILLAKKINDIETGWCLGATIQMLDSMVQEGKLYTCSKKWNLNTN